jgi:hypothetical protein
VSAVSRAPLLLLLASAAAGPASAAPSTGRVTAELPDVSVSAPALLGVLGWAGLVEPALEPTQLAARFQALIGVDPLSAPSLREAGVDPSKPLSIVVDDARRQLLVEGHVLDLARARAHLEKLRARTPGAAPLTGKGVLDGFVVGPTPGEALAVVLRAGSVAVLVGAGYRSASGAGLVDDTRRAPEAAAPPKAGAPGPSGGPIVTCDPVPMAQDARLALLAKPRAKPARPSKALLEGGRVDLWAVIEPDRGAERVDVVLRASATTLQLDAEVSLSLPAEVVLTEGLRGRASARRLVEPGAIALDARATLSRAGLRALLARRGLPESLAGLLAGPVQLGFADDGTAYAAAALEPRAQPKALVEALSKLVPGVVVDVLPGLVVARLGDRALAAAEGVAAPSAPSSAAPGASSTASTGASFARGAVAVDVVPRAVLGALERHRTVLGIRPMELMMARLMVARLVAATPSASLDVSMPTNRLRATLRIQR